LPAPSARHRDFWYQVETVRKVLKQFRAGAARGRSRARQRTIEAGMVLKEYLLRGMVDSVLVLAPASARSGSGGGVGDKVRYSLPRRPHDALLRSDPDRFWNQSAWSASLALPRRSEHAGRLIGRSWDLVIVDEAHHLRARNQPELQVGGRLNSASCCCCRRRRCQNDLTELYNVLPLLKPGIFKTLKEFRAAYVTPGKPRQPANPSASRVECAPPWCATRAPSWR